MAEQILTKMGNIYPGGVCICDDGSINVAVAFESNNCGIIFSNGQKELKVPFDSSYRIGKVYCVNIKGLDYSRYN